MESLSINEASGFYLDDANSTGLTIDESCSELLQQDVKYLEDEVTQLKRALNQAVQHLDVLSGEANKLQAVRKELAAKKQETCVNAMETAVLKSQVDALSKEVEELRGRVAKQDEQITHEKEATFRLKAEKAQLAKSLSNEGQRCSMLLGTMWRMSEEEHAVEKLLSGGRPFAEFLKYVATSMDELGRAQGMSRSKEIDHEEKANISMVGIMANMTATPVARDTILHNDAGRSCVQKAISLLSARPSPGYRSLRVILQLLHNISLSDAGMKFFGSYQLSNILFLCFLDDDPNSAYQVPEVRLRLVQLIHSLILHSDKINHPFPSDRVAYEFVESLINDPTAKVAQAAKYMAEDFLLGMEITY